MGLPVFKAGQVPVVPSRYVEVTHPAVLNSRDPDDLESRMVLRIEKLSFQRLKAAAENVGTGGVQLLG